LLNCLLPIPNMDYGIIVNVFYENSKFDETFANDSKLKTTEPQLRTKFLKKKIRIPTVNLSVNL